MKVTFDQPFLRFMLVGVINTVVGTAVMFGMYNGLHCSYWISSAANYVAGSVVSYFLNKHFTFHNTEKGILPVIKFIVNITICYGLAYGIAKPTVKALLASQSVSVQENAAMLAGMVLFVVLNYLGQRFFAFRGHKSEGEFE